MIIFSPHPDDDVISMGGTFDRLITQGHEVHVVYQTSGNIAVSNEEALKFAEIGLVFDPNNTTYSNIVEFINQKNSSISDILELRNLKAQIRQKESLATTRFLGLPDNQVHFLNLPFYETGTIKKSPLSQVNIDLMKDKIEEIQPHQIYAAGDFADPYGTHKVCLDSLFMALQEIKHKPFMDDCWVWLYRGAWYEWDIHEIEMAVPNESKSSIAKTNRYLLSPISKGWGYVSRR